MSISKEDQLSRSLKYTCKPGLSEENNVNNPFSTSIFIADFPPPIEPLQLCKELLCKCIATSTDEDTSVAGSGVSSSKLLKTLQSIDLFVYIGT